MEQHFCKISARHNKFRNEINVKVTVGAETFRRCTSVELFVEVCQIERGAVSAVVIVSVHLKHAHSLDTNVVDGSGRAWMKRKGRDEGSI